MPKDAVRCQTCKGEGAYWFTPFRCSPPNGKGSGGYEGNSNIPTLSYTHCQDCGGKGHHTPEDIRQYYQNFLGK